MIFESVFADGKLVEFLNKNKHDPWIDTPFENYVYLLNTQKGKFGEMFVERYMRNKGSVVTPRQNTGHDRMIDGYKTEIKFSLCVRSEDGLSNDTFIINHISKNKDWERLIFFGINYNFETSRMIWFDKEDFSSHSGLFKTQQGGKDVGNDDFMYAGHIVPLMNLPFVKTIDEWTEKTSILYHG